MRVHRGYTQDVHSGVQFAWAFPRILDLSTGFVRAKVQGFRAILSMVFGP